MKRVKKGVDGLFTNLFITGSDYLLKKIPNEVSRKVTKVKTAVLSLCYFLGLYSCICRLWL